MTSDILCLNPSNAELMLIGLIYSSRKVLIYNYISVKLDFTSTYTFTKNSSVHDLIVVFDPQPQFHRSYHPSLASRIFVVHDLRRIRAILDLKTSPAIATFVLAKQNYFNSLFLNK